MTEKDLQATPGYVLVDPKKVERKSEIYLPDTQKESKPQTGYILSVGGPIPDGPNQMQEASCKEGDLVLYKRWDAIDFKVPEGKELLFVKFDQVLALVTE